MSGYKQWLTQFSEWLKDIKHHELDELIEKFVEQQQALQQSSKEKIQQYHYYLRRDLEHFSAHHRHYHDLAWQELKASIWYELSQLEDRTQLEWQALLQDFEHDGVYKQGEWIAMGQLVCKNCDHKLDVLYPSEISPCSECEHTEFTRKALSP